MPGVSERENEALWAAGLDAARVLHGAGHEAFLVGGCVRDRLLGRPLHDVDIATSAKPEEVTAAFARTIPTGLKHGTVTVLHGGYSFEVTTFRTESGYSDARRPDRVEFVHDIREDLARRDFTINAMAFGLDGQYVDPFGGRRDLARKLVRCVGDADRRFGEDALRMVRAIRFASAFGFALAPSVWKGIRAQAGRLSRVAMERVGSEWDKMMAGADPERACRLLLRSGLLEHAKEKVPRAVLSGASRCGRAGVRELAAIADPELRWAAWLLRRGASPEEAAALCRTLRYSGKRQTRISAVLAFDRQIADMPPDRSAFVSCALQFGRDAARDWLETRADRAVWAGWLTALTVDSVSQLAVKGDELAFRLGRPPGPWVAALLRRLLEDVALGRLPNERNALLEAADAAEIP